MKILLIIVGLFVYLVIGRVIVLALVKHGVIEESTLDDLLFVPYLFLPITFFVIGVREVSNWVAIKFNLRDPYYDNHI